MNCRRIILRFALKNWYQYVIGTVAMLVSTVFTTYIPKQIGVIIDMFTSHAAHGEILRQIVFLIGITFLSFWFLFVWHFLLITMCRGIDRDLRQGLFEHLQKQSPDFYIKNNTGDLLTRSIVDIQAVRAFFGNYIVSLLDIFATLVIAIYFMLTTAGVRITLICAAPAPVLVLILFLIRRHMRIRYRLVQQAASDIGARVQENVTGIRVVKAFTQEKAECERFNLLSREKWRREVRAVAISAAISPSTNFIYALTFSVFLILGGQQVIAGNLTIGEYTAFNGYLMQILSPMSRFGSTIQAFLRCRVSMKRLDEIFYSRPSVTDERAEALAVPDRLDLRVDGLTFRYPGTEHDVLTDVSFDVKPGELVCIMGPTGCGKTTIANLLERLWEPAEHMIWLNGREIHKYPLRALRSAVSYVPQDTLLFADTVANNISFNDAACTREKVEECARLAAVHDSIAAFPDGYETMVGERGVTLSGGQKQRVAIARALCADPKLLLMDDSLSAVDTETEEEILNNLRHRRSGCSVILITHRISAAILADRVLFLTEDGAVSGFAPHEELLRTDPAYKHLFDNASGAAAEGGSDNG